MSPEPTAAIAAVKPPGALECSLGCLSRSDGSSSFALNSSTKVLCSVYGPGEVKIMKELSNRAAILITYKPRIGQPTNKEKINEYSIKSICDGAILSQLHPRTAIQLTLQEVETAGTSGNQLACAVNAACMALLDASIPLKYSFAAVHSCILRPESADAEDKDATMVTDVSSRIVHFPTAEEESQASLIVTFVFDSIDHDVMFVNTSGVFDQTAFDALLNSAQGYARANLFLFFNEQIKQKHALNLLE